jgi:surface protein
MLLDENAPIISNNSQNKNIIKGEIELKSNDINNSVIIFKSDYNYEIDLYLNNKKTKIIKDNGSWKIDYNFNKEGKYNFTMVFNDTIIDMEEFFGKSSYLISLDLTDFDSSNVTNMRILFNKCKRLKEIKGIEKLNTKNVIDMEGMFQYCTELDYLDISNFDTSKVESMAFMFNHCEKLKELKGLNKFITNNVTTTEGMFQSCFSIEYLDLSNFDTSNVIIMDYMFEECSRLKGIKGLNKLITSKVVSMEGLFQLCTLLKYVDLSNFDTSNVINMGYMFNKCKKLKEIKGMNHFNTANLKSTFAMFQYALSWSK